MIQPDLVDIPAGRFVMGSTRAEVDACVATWGGRLVDPAFVPRFASWIEKEHPAHEVDLGAFAIGRFPVTNREYAAFVDAGGPAAPSVRAGEPADHPVWGVSLDDAQAYCRWLGERLGRDVRLPTEAEWERAARGPDHREYPFGDVFAADRCNTIEGGIGSTTAVDRYADHPSGWGVCDLAGNVEEWTSSVYQPYPGGVWIDDDVSAAAGGPYPILRGGLFTRGGDLARSARRHGPVPGDDYRYRGFRIVADPPRADT